MILQIQTTINWESIKNKKRILALENNRQEIKTRVSHTYNVGDKSLITSYRGNVRRKLEQPNEVPYEILEVHDNGTVNIWRNTYSEKINTRRLNPYKD